MHPTRTEYDDLMVDPTPQDQLEHDLAQAQDLGRWLSDDERLERQRAEQQALTDKQQQDQHRLKLVALAIVCVVIPPLWPLAFGITLHLLFPKTFGRLLWVAGGSAVVLGLLTVGVGLAIATCLWMLIQSWI